jgi:hypothetical protein
MLLLFTSTPLWSNGKSSWLQITRSGFDSRRYPIFWEAVGLERDALLERKSSGFGLEILDYGCRDPPRWPRNISQSAKKLALTLPTIGGRSVGIGRPQTQAPEFILFYFLLWLHRKLSFCRSEVEMTLYDTAVNGVPNTELNFTHCIYRPWIYQWFIRVVTIFSTSLR